MPVKLLVLREGREIVTTITPNTRTVNGEELGFIGAGVAPVAVPDEFVRELNYSATEALMKE